MPKKRIRRKSTPSRTSAYMRHLFQEFLIAVFIILILLFIFVYSYEDGDSAVVGQAAGGIANEPIDSGLYDNVRLCVEGQQSACDKVHDNARIH